MPDKVVDASALAAIVFGEPQSGAVQDRIRGATLHAPTLLPFELTSIAAKKIRAHPDLRARITAALGDGLRLPVRLVVPDHQRVLEVALASGLTPYDAAYLCVARDVGADLVTLDKRLAAAAR